MPGWELRGYGLVGCSILQALLLAAYLTMTVVVILFVVFVLCAAITCHVVVGAELSSSGELLLRAHLKLIGACDDCSPQMILNLAGYLKSTPAVAEEVMFNGWSSQRQREWESASFCERL